ncbi:MAG: serine/threonine protein kinase [Phycisphaerales bacterium]|nr:serine/threonine protein kinase [Phycisphaerales bacterium]
MIRPPSSAATPLRPGATGSESEVARLIDYLTGGVAPGTDSPPAAGLWIMGSVGPLLADGEPRYRLLETIGQGATATVYEATDRLLSTESSEALVAVKVSRCDREGDAEGLLAEARNARRVEHRNVLRVLDCGRTADGRVFTVLELIEGPTLEGFLASSPGPGRREVVRLLVGAARGLEAIHAAGLVHCDLKPANMLVGPDGTVRIADFGAATAQTRKAPLADAATPDARGTLAFMAPEQFRLERGALTPSSDIFSFGATLFWALTGEAAAGGCSLEALSSLSTPEGLRPEQLDRRLRLAGVERDLRAITVRALAPAQRDRYGSAGVLAGELELWLARRPLLWTRSGPVRRTRLAARRHPVAAAAIVLASLGAAAAVAAHADARRLGREAEVQRNELLIEKSKRETDAAWRKRSLDSLMKLMSGFRSAKEQGLASEVLTSLWVLEWAHGPTLLEDPGAVGAIWATRIEVLQSLHEEARARGGADSIEARLMEPSLSLWLLRDGRPEEARPILDDAIRFWEHHAAANDSWLLELGTLRAAAEVMSLRRTASVRSLTRDETEHLASGETILAGARDALRADKGPVAQLVRDVLGNAPATGN